MIDRLRKVIQHVWRTDRRLRLSQSRSLILEVKAEVDETIGYRSRVSLRVPAGYNTWRALWMVNEKGKLRYPRRKQREHRPVRIYDLHPDPYYRSPYSLPRQKGRFRVSSHFPFAPDEEVIAEFVVYTSRSLTAEESQTLHNIVDEYSDGLSGMVSATYVSGTEPELH